MGDFNNHEELLVKKAIKGDKEALGLVLQQNQEYIYKMAYIYTGNQQDALDILQEAAAQSVSSIRTLKEPKYFLTWFCKIMVRQTGKLFKSRQHEVLVEENQEWADQAGSVLSEETSVDLLRAIMALEDKYRLVLHLYYYQDFSIREISQLVGLKEGTVKTNLKRGRERLRGLLGDDYYDR
ncbi:sigma-70 family RNA polymerase sigma factor [Candidatus Enterococcus clewellii]|uniref:RNA polymerase sigma-70 factor, ECF subfamily n=1 Tax=Candidatus Enterococcus clewellii TaxID=1834193 RepID=A0A242K4I7_9ENTE|nr:sigma-70 family RNA polymerase sigma factor [Enterococcus sp. 9E7_DIV0242]OTP14438.1 hypothetical protein A5888_002539 [Enterococcus sp. 9E7_DIV0242]